MGGWVSSLIVNLLEVWLSLDRQSLHFIDRSWQCLFGCTTTQLPGKSCNPTPTRISSPTPLLPRFPNLPYRNNRSSVRNKRDRTSRSELRTRFGEKGGRPCPGRTIQIPVRWTVDCYRSPTTWRLPAITTTDSRQGGGGEGSCAVALLQVALTAVILI